MIEIFSPNKHSRMLVNETGAALSELWFGETQIVGSPDKYSGVTLFPWPNRIVNGQWTYQTQDLQLEINDSVRNAALHGLVFDKPFQAVSIRGNACQLTLDLEEVAGYPFAALLGVRFELMDNRLLIWQTVTNRCAKTMPFAIGIHPYFKADENALFGVAGKDLQLSTIQVDETIGPKCSKVELRTALYDLQISAHDTEFIHIFTNRYDEPGQLWFAIEPQSSPADSLNNGIGLSTLDQGESKTFKYEFSLQKRRRLQ